jgi:hypothetical protein
MSRRARREHNKLLRRFAESRQTMRECRYQLYCLRKLNPEFQAWVLNDVTEAMARRGIELKL